ncbi:DUF5708 family protein [Streptomyces phaeochromogenes]|uniref:DUF5708 family protein n=1 Tax=Streptomyces phaeochromogenes TaxID=1923 RepID=UPI0033E78D9F
MRRIQSGPASRQPVHRISFVSLPKAGVVMMVIGGVQTLFGLFQATRTSSARG